MRTDFAAVKGKPFEVERDWLADDSVEKAVASVWAAFYKNNKKFTLCAADMQSLCRSVFDQGTANNILTPSPRKREMIMFLTGQMPAFGLPFPPTTKNMHHVFLVAERIKGKTSPEKGKPEDVK